MARSLLMNIPPGHITTFTYQGNDSCFTMYVDFNNDIGIKANYINNGNNTTTVSVYATALEKRPTRIQFEGVSDFNSRLINIHYINFTTLTSLYKMFYNAQYLTSLNTAYITIKSTIDISYTNLDAFSIQSIINSLYDYSGNSSALSNRIINVGSLSISDTQKAQIINKNWILSRESLNLTFIQNKKLNNDTIIDTDDNKFYTSFDLVPVKSGSTYNISLNLANYICILYYDHDYNVVDYFEANTSDWSVTSPFNASFVVPSNVAYLIVCATSDGTQITGALNEIS